MAAVSLAVSAGSCSADDGITGTAPTTATSQPPPPPPTPGTVTLDVTDVTDARNLVMVGVIGKNVPTQPMAAVCALVNSDPYDFTGEYVPITGGDPCSVGTSPVEFDPGTYEVVVAVMEGGATSPHRCARADIRVDGDVTVEINGLGPPGDCGF